MTVLSCSEVHPGQDVYHPGGHPVEDQLGALMGRLESIAEHLARVDALLTEFEPVLRAYLDPAASGPVAWAVRRQQKKGPHHG